MAVSIEQKSAERLRLSLLARTAARSLFLFAVTAGLWMLVRHHSRVLPTLLTPPPTLTAAISTAAKDAPAAAPPAARAPEQNARFGNLDRKVESALPTSRPRPQPRPLAERAAEVKDLPPVADVSKKEAPTSSASALSKSELQRLETAAPPAPGKESRAEDAAANTVIANAATAAPAEGVSVEQTPQEKSVVPDWEKEEIRQPIAGAYAVVYVSRRFLGLCLAGKYIRRYKQIGVNLPGGLPVEKIVGHWRVADQEGEAGAGQLRLVPATVAADSPREMLICGHGQTTDLVALFLEPEQVEEIARALPAAAWVVIQP